MAFCSVKVYRVFSLFAQSECGAVRSSAVKSAPETSARRLIQTGTVEAEEEQYLLGLLGEL